MTTINDLYREYELRCGSGGPARTRDELRAEFHKRGFVNYEAEGPMFLNQIFDDGWAWGLDEEIDYE